MGNLQSITFKIKGTCPLLVHNDQMVDPLNPHTRAMKELTKKRKKTDEDHEEIARIEWEAGLYFEEDIGPFLPAANIEAMVREAAKLSKEGKKIQRGVQCEQDRIPIEYDGPRKVEPLYADGRFRDRRSAKVGMSKVIRTRPIFRDWELSFSLLFMDDIISERDLIAIVHKAGRVTAMGDYRPRFGRFVVTHINGKKVKEK